MPCFFIFTSPSSLGRSRITSFHQIKRFISESHYDVLKLPQTCSSKEVRDAFIRLSKQNHPDRHFNDPTMHNRFIRINEAYNTLINPSSRRCYDMSLRVNRKLEAPSTARGTQSTEGADGWHDPTFWSNRDRSQDAKYENQPFYGIKGVKKVSNMVVLFFVLGVAVCVVCLQLLSIRSSFLRNHEYMLEQSQKNSMIYALTREKAKLYGNDHQLEVLKNALKATCDVTEEAEALEVAETAEDLLSIKAKHLTSSN